MNKRRSAMGHEAMLTGDIAEDIAVLLLRRLGLTPRRDDKDRGEDLSIEIRDHDGRLARAWVQVKGSATYTRNVEVDGAWRVAVRANAITRYRSSSHLVILLAPDITTNEVRWTPLRPHVELKNVPDGKAGAFYLGPGDVITPNVADAFLDRLAQLVQDLRAAQADFPALLSARGAQMEALDPRFLVRVAASGEGVVHTIIARDEPVTVQVAVQPASPYDAEALRDAIAFGSSRKIGITLINYEGSPLFDALGAIEPETLEVGAIPTVSVAAVGTIDPSSHTFTRVYPGKVEGRAGLLGNELHFLAPEVPLEIRIRMPHNEPGAATINLTWRTDHWIGRQVSDLPYLVRTRQLAERLLDGHRLALAITIHDEDRVAMIFRVDGSAVEHVNRWTQILSDLAQVDQAYGIGTVVRGEPALVEEIEALRALAAVIRGERTGTLRPRRFRFDLTSAGEISSRPALYCVAMDVAFRLWSEDVARVPLILRLENYVAEPDGADGSFIATAAHDGTLRFMLDTREQRGDSLTRSDVDF